MIYRYRAIDARGMLVSGRYQSNKQQSLKQYLLEQELTLLSYRRVLLMGQAMPKGRQLRRERLHFTVQLQHLLSAGVPVVDALHTLAEQGYLARLCEVLAQRIESGSTFSQALLQEERFFGALYCQMCQLAEHSGTLPDMLNALEQQLGWQEQLLEQTRTLLLYPLIALVVILLTVSFMLLYLVPQLSPFFEFIRLQVPWYTQLLLGLSDLLRGYGVHLLWLLPLAISGYRIQVVKQCFKRSFQGALAMTPVGQLGDKLALSRFSRCLSLSYRSGVPVIEALQQARDMLGQGALGEALPKVLGQLQGGSSLHQAFASPGVFPCLFIRLIRTGEKTGDLSAALDHISDFYEGDARQSIARLQSLLVPVISLLLAAFLVWLVVALMLPLYDGLGGLGL